MRTLEQGIAEIKKGIKEGVSLYMQYRSSEIDIYELLKNAEKSLEIITSLQQQNQELQGKLEEANQWQPIETAPKDGSWFLAYDLKHQWRDCPPVCVVRLEIVKIENENKEWFCDPAGIARHNLTHWMPLPKPPINKINGGSDESN